MPRLYKCSFCGHDFPPGTGMMLVKNDGSALRFCSRKCRRSSVDFGRDSRRLPWTAYFGREEKGRG